MDLPLSKREWKLYYELKSLFKDNKQLALESSDYHKYEDWLDLLRGKGVIMKINADNACIIFLQSDFDEFEAWIKDQNNKAKRPSRREWRIGIVSAIIGAVASAVFPWIIQIFSH